MSILEDVFLSIDLSEYNINDNFEQPIQCEICYNTQDCDLIDTLNTNFKGTSLSQMLDHFSSIKDIRFNEHSSKHTFFLCVVCVKQLVSSYLFLEKIRKSNERFKGLVKIKEQHEDEENSLNTKSIFKVNTLKKNDSVDKTSVGGENFISNKEDPGDSLLGEHVGINHDHSYIQNNDNHDFDTTAGQTENSCMVDNSRLLIEKSPEQERNFLCDLCSAGFCRKQSLNYHIRRIHLNEKSLLCPICGKQFFLQVDYNRHILLHKGESSYKCNLCKKSFVTFGLLKNHKRNVHKAKEIKCIKCPKMFKLQSQLNKHLVGVHHPSEKGSVVKEKEQCSVCGKKINKQFLKTHMEQHSGSRKYQCEVCGRKFFQNLALNNHMKRHQAPEFSCEYCGKTLFTKQEMLTHIRRQHTREIICTCQHCGKGFVHQSNLIQHIRNCHPGDNEEKFVEPKIPKQCTVCGKVYASRTSLIHHRKRTHEHKEHPCTKCDMTFRNLVPLKNHLKKIHNIGDTYGCEMCNKNFYTREELNKHRKRTHQIGTNPLYLRCTACNIEKFKTKHELIQHIQREHLIDDATDTPVIYECNVCVTFFVNFKSYQNHLSKAHSGNTGEEMMVLEYEMGRCKVQYFQNRRNNADVNLVKL